MLKGYGRWSFWNVLKWLRENGFYWNEWVCEEAARGEHIDILEWARINGCNWDLQTCYAAYEGGHPEVLKWMKENGCPCNGLLF